MRIFAEERGARLLQACVAPGELLIACHARLEEVLHSVRHDGHTGAIVVSDDLGVVVTTEVQSDGLGVLDREVQSKEAPAFLQARTGSRKFEVVHAQHKTEL